MQKTDAVKVARGPINQNKVLFGRENGEVTLGKIVKCNPQKAKVQILEERGSKSQKGAVWSVPYEMLEHSPQSEPGQRHRHSQEHLTERRQLQQQERQQRNQRRYGGNDPLSAIFGRSNDGDTLQTITPPELKYNPSGQVDNLLLEAILCVYSSLSPENLSGDGELPRSQVIARKVQLERKLNHLQQALGYNVSETQAYQWSRSKDEWDRKHA